MGAADEISTQRCWGGDGCVMGNGGGGRGGWGWLRQMGVRWRRERTSRGTG